ncbi:hypothetical protein QYF36_023185 [Acer negundo]|nr:hypothetical protein QYF36_023185 [Acer negundo]
MESGVRCMGNARALVMACHCLQFRGILPLLLQRFHRPNPSLHLFLLGFASTRIDHPCSHPFQLLVLSPNSSAKPAPDNIDFSVFFVMKSNSAQ